MQMCITEHVRPGVCVSSLLTIMALHCLYRLLEAL